MKTATASLGVAGKLVYTCPMHPEVKQDYPGDCPKCGMTLEPITASEVVVTNVEPAFRKIMIAPADHNPSAGQAVYTCPMHPEVKQDHPGDCPKCGMALEPKTVAADSEEDDTELRDMRRRFRIGG